MTIFEIGELILDRKVDIGLASDWHQIGSGLAKNGSDRFWIVRPGGLALFLRVERYHPIKRTCSMVNYVTGHGLAGDWHLIVQD